MKIFSSELKSLHFLWGGLAFTVYFGLIGLLLIYFNQYSNDKPKRFVKKDEKRIQVMAATSIKAIKVKTIVEKPKPKPKPKKIEVISKKEKVISKEKIITKKIIKKKDVNLTKLQKKKPIKINKPKVKVKQEVTKPKKPKKIEKPKKPIVKKTSDLFSSVKTTKKETNVVKNTINVTDKPKSVDDNTNSNNESDSGVENAYFSKVRSLLETWPAQSDYAGEMAMVSLYVKPTGMFEFKVKSKSNNVDFNLGLLDFLMQLQRMGLGSHEAGKTYEIKVEFIAKE